MAIGICPKCKEEFDNTSKWGPKKFCSRKCANSRIQTKEINNARRKSLGSKNLPCKYCKKICKQAGSLAMHERSCKNNSNRISGTFAGKKHSTNTKIKIGVKNSQGLKIPKNILDISSRTISKILQRMNIGCSNCGWNKAVGDIHHILPKRKGGTNDHSNLTYLCPNCHRLAHSNKLSTLQPMTEQIGEAWRDYYYAHDTILK
jgi:hypothetical protein